MKAFNYEQKVWGANKIEMHPYYLGALRIRYCLEALKNVKGKVLDIGCGAGGMTKALKKYRPDLTFYGCDVSKKAISEAKKNNAGVEFVITNVNKLPFKNNYFDAVVLFDVLEHVDDPMKIIEQTKSVLKNGGIFHAFIPCEGSKLCYIYWTDKVGWFAKEHFAGHIQRIKPREIQNQIRDFGFVPIERKWSNHLVYQLFDFIYFSLLALRGQNVSASLEGIVEAGKKTVGIRTLQYFLRAIGLISYFESRFIPFLPAMGLHLTVQKMRMPVEPNHK